MQQDTTLTTDHIRPHAQGWRVDVYPASLHWAVYDTAGNRTAQGSDWTTTPTEAELARWDALLPQVIAGPWAALAQQPLYIRFGNLPQGGRSRNHATGQHETGVSCYEASLDPLTGRVSLDGPGLAGAAVFAAFGAYGGVALLLTGERIGYGSDGEPLLRRPQTLGRLEPTDNGDYRVHE